MDSETKIGLGIAFGFLIMTCGLLTFFTVVNFNRKKRLVKETKIQTLEHEKRESELKRQHEIREAEHNRQIENFRLVNETEEKEKQIIAKNLHDGVLPILSTTFRSLGKNVTDFGTKDFDLERMKADVKNLNEAIVSLRGVSHNLVPPFLLSYGLIAALEQFLGQLTLVGQSETIFKNESGYGKDLPIAMSDQLNIYRVCLELLNNTLKHGQYSLLTFNVEKEGDFLTFDIHHDGKKVSNEEMNILTLNSTGLGLKSIQSRLLILNATIEYTEALDFARIYMRFPIKN